MMTPQNIGPFVAQGAKDLYGYVTKNPERSIEIAGPAAGATMGGAVGTIVPGIGTGIGALLGAGAGYLYGKANRAASNVSQGKPVTTGMPQTPGAAAMEPIDAILGNAGPEMVLPSVVRGLRAAGTHLVGSAMHPPLSTVNNMAEMGRRGTLPMDVRKAGAVDAINLANRHGNASPVSDANVRSLVGELNTDLNAVTKGAEDLRDAGKTLDMGPITGEAGGYAVHSVRGSQGVGGSFTPTDKLPAVRARIRAYQTDPEATTTVLSASGRRVPNPAANPVDVLAKRRNLSGDLRGAYGLNPDNSSAMIVDKSMYRGTGEALRDASPEIGAALDREHQGMNLLQMMVPQQYLQSGAKPVNLYTLLGTLSGNPAAIALGIGNYPYVMAAGGKGLYNAGTRVAEHSGDTANLTRAILATMLANQQQDK